MVDLAGVEPAYKINFSSFLHAYLEPEGLVKVYGRTPIKGPTPSTDPIAPKGTGKLCNQLQRPGDPTL